jgi:hypothetical protein
MDMQLTLGELSYSRQKNREHAWRQANDERLFQKNSAKDFSRFNEKDFEWIESRFDELCRLSNI